MPSKRAAKKPALLSPLQRQAAALLADGATEERVAKELGVSLDWVHGLEGSLPVAAEVVHQQWRRYRNHNQRIRSLLDRALDVVEQELQERPTAELAIALLRSLKVEAPSQPIQTPEQMLLVECEAVATQQIQVEEYRAGFAFGQAGQVRRRMVELLDQQAERLIPPADPVDDAEPV